MVAAARAANRRRKQDERRRGRRRHESQKKRPRRRESQNKRPQRREDGGARGAVEQEPWWLHGHHVPRARGDAGQTAGPGRHRRGAVGRVPVEARAPPSRIGRRDGDGGGRRRVVRLELRRGVRAARGLRRVAPPARAARRVDRVRRGGLHAVAATATAAGGQKKEDRRLPRQAEDQGRHQPTDVDGGGTGGGPVQTKTGAP